MNSHYLSTSADLLRKFCDDSFNCSPYQIRSDRYVI